MRPKSLRSRPASALASIVLLVLSAAASASTYNVDTTCSWVSDVYPSSCSDSFTVTLLETNPAVEDMGAVFKDCTVSDEPADLATNVGLCRWTTFADDGFNLTYFRFNWRQSDDPNPDGIFGQYNLINDLGFGNWVRFYTPDGTGAAVGGSSSGGLSYEAPGQPPPYPNNIYVDGSVAASGDGTPATPFKTINEAIGVAVPGTGIHIAAGTYQEYVPIAQKTDIGLIGAGKDAVTISNPGGYAIMCNTVEKLKIYNATVRGQNGIGMVACKNAEFSNISTEGSVQSGIVVANLNPASPSTPSQLTLRDSSITHSTYGVSLDHTSSMSAYNTEFSDNAEHGIKVTSSGSLSIDGCDLSRNNFGLNWQNTGSGPGTLSLSNSTIANNALTGMILLNAVDGDISRSTFEGNGTAGRFNGLEVEWTWRGTLTISDSNFTNNTQFGVFISSGNVSLQNNVIEGNGQNGVGIHQSASQGTSQQISVALSGNTIRNHLGTSSIDGIGLMMWQEDGPMMTLQLDGNTFSNNAEHASCSSRANRFGLSCTGNVYGSSQRGKTFCNRELCSLTDCPELCQ